MIIAFVFGVINFSNSSIGGNSKLSSILEKININPFNTTEEFIISSDEYEDLPSINITLRKNESVTLNV